ncbi:MAG: prepilin-type N-terminal cleavage/methylation domain-containing protein [Planctomycetes bacterium]|nr:prepilin-type N-terminal cleavage/methylation domain-containing protein [Planctomycetota bacterium]
MRKAFTLVELLVVVTIVPFIMITVSGVYATFLRDIPQTMRVLQESTTVLDLLRQIRADAEEAVGLPEEFEGRPADDRTLLIEQPGRIIRYQRREGRIVRIVTPADGSSSLVPPRSSPANDADRGTSNEATGGIAKASGLDDGEPATVAPRRAALDAATPVGDGNPMVEDGRQDDECFWRVRDAVITWQVWRDGDRAYAVEIHTHVRQWIAGILREKLANSHVYFIHGLWPRSGALALAGGLSDLRTVVTEGQIR